MTTGPTFVCYSRTDSDFVLKLAKDLRDAGAEIWLDKLDIEFGSRWDDSIEIALNASSCILVIVSPESVASDHVKDEFSAAMDNGKKIIPVLLADCITPLRLRRFQHIDFRGDYQTGFNHLLETLNHSVKDNKENSFLFPPVTSQTASPEISYSENNEQQEKTRNLLIDPIPAVPQVKYKIPVKNILTLTGLFLMVFFMWKVVRKDSLEKSEKLKLTADSLRQSAQDSAMSIVVTDTTTKNQSAGMVEKQPVKTKVPDADPKNKPVVGYETQPVKTKVPDATSKKEEEPKVKVPDNEQTNEKGNTEMPEAPMHTDYHDNPVKVVQVIFEAARHGDYWKLSNLCDKNVYLNRNTREDLCNIETEKKEKKAEFKKLYSNGQIIGEAIFSKIDNTAKVKIKFGPDGKKEKWITLINKEGKWYVSRF